MSLIRAEMKVRLYNSPISLARSALDNTFPVVEKVLCQFLVLKKSFKRNSTIK